MVPANNPRVFGATSFENAYLVDGINITDSSTGTWSGFGLFDAIAEESVLTGGIGADFGFGTGGVVNLVTKSGGNLFSGTVDARYRDDRFNESGDHYDPATDVFSRSIVSATLGGPIVRDRLWFFVGYEYGIGKTTPVDSPGTQTTRARIFRQADVVDQRTQPSDPVVRHQSHDHRLLRHRLVHGARRHELRRMARSGGVARTQLGDFRLPPADRRCRNQSHSLNSSSSPMVNDLETPPEID